MDELEIMRQQMAAMKRQLDTQHIINQDLMRKVMRSKASWLNRLVKYEFIALPFIYLLFVAICYFYSISQWYAFVILIGTAIDATFDIRTVRIPPQLFSSSTLLGLKKFLIRQKKERFFQTVIGGGFCVIYLFMFGYAMITASPLETSGIIDNDLWQGAKTGGIIGGVIGMVVALIGVITLFRKMQSTNDQLLRDINDLEQE